jgi:hypothetical protein
MNDITYNQAQNEHPNSRYNQAPHSNHKVLVNGLIIFIYLIYMIVASLVDAGINQMRANETENWLDGEINYELVETDDGYDFTFFGNLENISDQRIDLVRLRFDLLDENDEVIESVYHNVRYLDIGENAPLRTTYSVDNDAVDINIYTQIPDDPTLSTVLNVVVSALALLALWLVNKDNYIKNFKETKKSFKSFFGLVAVGFVLVYAANIMAQSIMQLFESPETSLNETAIQNMFNANPINLFGLFLSLVILAPIIEETVFRKGLYNLIEHRFGDILAIIVSGFIFGFLHVAGWGDYINVLPYLAMGLSFSFIYYYSDKNVFVVIMLHMINNLIPFATYFMDSIN